MDSKRKRTKNTTKEQTKLYIEYMQKDVVFRTGKINPTLPPNYIETKWEELSNELNALGSGPQLSGEEWKKRFANFKYITKEKCRKIAAHRNRTGGGPKLQLQLSELEEAALDVWGRVTVTGVNATPYEGIPIDENPQHHEINEYFEFEGEEIEPITSEIVDTENVQIIDVAEVDNDRTQNRTSNFAVRNVQVIDVAEVDNERTQNKTKPVVQARNRIRTKPLSEIANQLIEVTNESGETMKKMTNVIEKLGNKYIEIQEKKLKFEIAKYCYENPNFSFSE